MTAGLFSPLVERAMRVAAKAHRNQTRKATDLPYVTHPASVALILARAGFDDDVTLAAALLHDVVEDTEIEAAELEREFPSSVIGIVRDLSEKKTDETGKPRPWKVRKTEHLEHIPRMSPAARAVLLADKLHNLGTMLLDCKRLGESIWERFNASRDQIFWYHEATILAVNDSDPRIRLLRDSCRNLLDQLRGLSTSPENCG